MGRRARQSRYEIHFYPLGGRRVAGGHGGQLYLLENYLLGNCFFLLGNCFFGCRVVLALDAARVWGERGAEE